MKKIFLIFIFLMLFMVSCVDNPVKPVDPDDPDDKTNENNSGNGEDPNENGNQNTKEEEFVEINNNHEVITIFINLNTEEYKTDFHSNIMKAEITNEKNYQYMVVTFSITNNKYKIRNDVNFYINDELVSDHYTVESDGSKLVYKVNDPNWTPFY